MESYYEIPPDILEEPEELIEWALNHCPFRRKENEISSAKKNLCKTFWKATGNKKEGEKQWI